MASKQRRRLYEGFGVLEQEQKNNSENSTNANETFIEEAKFELKNGVEKELKQGLNTVSTTFKHSFKNTETTSISVEMESKQTAKQSRNRVEQHGLDTIVGKEKEFLFFISYECQKNGALYTEPLTSEKLKSVLNHSTDGLKTVIYRLGQKSLIHKRNVKSGRSGWVVFELEKDIYDQLISDKHYFNTISTRFKHTSKESLNGGYSSNDLYLNKNTITTEPTFKIPENLKSVGIGQKNLESILNLKILSGDEIQESLNHYAYDIEKGVKPNLALFFGVLRKGSNYISQKYSIELQTQIEAEILRINKAKNHEAENLKSELYLKFQDYKNNNPRFIEEIKNSQRFNISENILENIAFSKFCELNND